MDSEKLLFITISLGKYLGYIIDTESSFKKQMLLSKEYIEKTSDGFTIFLDQYEKQFTNYETFRSCFTTKEITLEEKQVCKKFLSDSYSHTYFAVHMYDSDLPYMLEETLRYSYDMSEEEAEAFVRGILDEPM